VIGAQRFIHLDENVLSKIFGFVARTGEAVANVVDAPVILANDVLPGSCVASHTATDQSSYDLGVLQPALPGTPGNLQTQYGARAPPGANNHTMDTLLWNQKFFKSM